MNIFTLISTLFLIGILFILLDMCTIFMRFFAKGDHHNIIKEDEELRDLTDKELNFVQRIGWYIYLVILFYVWLVWANFGANTVWLLAPDGWQYWLFTVIGFILTILPPRLGRRIKAKRLFEDGKTKHLKEYLFLKLATLLMFILTLIYKTAMPRFFSWFSALYYD